MKRRARLALIWQESEAVDHRHSRSVVRSHRACDLVARMDLAMNNHPAADAKAR